MNLRNMKVAGNRKIAADTYELKLYTGPDFKTSPGQFVHVLVDPPHYLRRPLSVASISRDELTLVYKTFGEGTKTLAGKKIGEEINILGPLGNGFTFPEEKRVMLIGGGVGVPPLLELASDLHEMGKSIHAVLGFKSEQDVFYEEELKGFAEVTVVTEDGSYGKKGLVTEWLDDSADIFYACGPNPMLRALLTELEIPGFISMEERMGCAIGACFACTIETTDGGYVNVCKDGPVFPKDKVVLP
ncbi:dihydroorotate dehydrogenase electron transfer subunit [Salimicrobium flavidum]|uniref:Dihydroorotate dehydrogenase B (NAD(+)), electron transfer subunit n=1 Tax=Salimicrobium flavidum TaxID=570947 RepID=A0A1N7ILB0_9BACI|nr:dihydroorotate dehydrogenase electron transfer subunit [Salimicrobium flavidum]SIS37855.1 dihydroorotate dehydrogenase electron transfer subunit [Salimicrobium flavidum]